MPAEGAQLTITAKVQGPGLFVSLKSEGEHASSLIDRRFYSIDQLPPDGINPLLFWAPLLAEISGFLASG